MLPTDVARSTRSDIARQFGESFADDILKVEPGHWAGPIRSGYGLHIVYVREREDGHMPTLAEVRSQVEREFTAERRRLQLDAMYARLLERSRVVIEKRMELSPAPGITTAPGAKTAK